VTILLINAVVGTLQENSARSALEALNKLQPEYARCLRDGVWCHELPASQLVPGDIIEVRVGDSVPADARIIALKTTTFATDEGSLTGESTTVSKSTAAVDPDSRIQQKTCIVFAGTVVSNGRAIALVTRTGSGTEIGAIQKGVVAAKADEEKTPLSQKLDAFGNKLTLSIGAICLVVWLINLPKIYQPAFSTPWRGALYYLKVAVALGVAAIPEGLPAVITLCLSLGTRRMAARKVIVRKLPSVETLGCTTVVCTDKTGTLTTNQMSVTSLVVPQQEGARLLLSEYEVDGVSYTPTGQVQGMSDVTLRGRGVANLAAVCSMCNDAELTYTDGQYGRIGEPTEAALKVLVEKLGVPEASPPPDAAAATDHFGKIRMAEYTKVATLEFSRKRKSMSVVCTPVNSARNVLMVKGAPESLLPRCSMVRLADGTSLRMTTEWSRRLKAQFEAMACRPLRCLALAIKEDGLGPLTTYRGETRATSRAASAMLADTDRFDEIESGLTFLGFVGIKDPARPEVPSAIARCRAAGIRVIMITGDSKETASAIAKDVNIFDAEEEDTASKTFVGGEFFEIPVVQQETLLRTSNLVFCRAEPQDKQRLLRQLQTLGEVAAMTGDGVNDAPALQQAAIGIAMGIAGTEVSKQAADMVLADDNFATIVAAVEEGRAIYANMKSFINFLITCNIGEVAAVFLATLLGLPEVLSPLHLLWVNLVTDGPPATALGFNPADPNNMKRKPRGREDPLVDQFTLVRYLLTGSYVGVATVGSFLHYYQRLGLRLPQLMGWLRCSEWEAGAVAGVEAPCTLFDASSGAVGKAAASTVALTTLVCMEMLRALCAVSERESLLRKPPWANGWLIAGVAVPSLLHAAVIYCRPLATLFQLVPLTRDDWKSIACFALPLLVLEELLKLIGRLLRA